MRHSEGKPSRGAFLLGNEGLWRWSGFPPNAPLGEKCHPDFTFCQAGMTFLRRFPQPAPRWPLPVHNPA